VSQEEPILSIAGAVAYGLVLGWLLVLVAFRAARSAWRPAVAAVLVSAALLTLTYAMADGAATAAAAAAFLLGVAAHTTFRAVLRALSPAPPAVPRT
jgi:NhaP-type Na+/H+ or K+/H+ antiporter